jgi:hypothetical protein
MIVLGVISLMSSVEGDKQNIATSNNRKAAIIPNTII